MKPPYDPEPHRDLDRRIAAARDFEGLCGLNMLPMAAYFILGALFPSSILWTWMLVVVGQFATRWYYRRHFGTLERGTDPGLQVAVAVIGVFLIIVLVIVTPATFHGVTWLPLLLAAALAGEWWWLLRHVGLTWVHALAVLAIGLLCLLPGGDGQVQHWGGIVIGIALAVVGIHDHRRLVRIIGKNGTSHE